MPSHLKSLELQGYKTFASRTLFEFAGNVTAIVGPNGSGKSNIADSLRWVLGEQSYSLLRGRRTEDMIFSGSEQRPRASMASATVVFDNADGWLPIDFSEVAITRRAYRDGSNEYLINGQRVRLKDVSELLAQSGLAERTYTIIGQGVVDAALALKAEERRRLFEEAAGIGLYRARREEALRRLEITRRNLDRVQDILAELQPRLRSLERQARRSAEYEQVRADLQILLHEWYGYHWHHAQQELAQAREFARLQDEALEKARRELAALDSQLAESRAQVHALRARLNSWHRQLAQLHTRQESLGRSLAVADERRRALEFQQVELLAEQSRLQEELASHEERRSFAQSETQRLQDEWDDARSQLENAQVALRERQAQRKAIEDSLQEINTSLARLGEKRTQLQARLVERKAQAESLMQEQEAAVRAASQAEFIRQQAQSQAQVSAQTWEESQAARQQLERALREERQHLEQLEAEHKELNQQLAVLETELARLNAQREVLEQAEASLAGYTQGAQVLLKAAREALLKADPQAFGVHLEAPAELETAIAAALGEYLDSVILDKGDSVETALDLLSGQASRGVLLPLDRLAPAADKGFTQDERLSLQAAGALGLASELVSCPPLLRPAVDLLLGNTLVVRDRHSARQVLNRLGESLRRQLRAVTLAGEVFYASGPILAGAETKSSSLSRSRQQKELAARIQSLSAEKSSLETSLSRSAAGLAEARGQAAELEAALSQALQDEEQSLARHRRNQADLEAAVRALEWQTQQQRRIQAEIQNGQALSAQISNELAELERQIDAVGEESRQLSHALAELDLDEFTTQVNHWNTLAAVAERALADSRLRLQERTSALERAQGGLASIAQRILETQQALENLEQEKAQQRQEEAQLSEQIEALRALIDPAEAELDAGEIRQVELQNAETAARQALTQAEHNHAQARIAQARRQEALETWRRRIEDDFGLVAFEYAEEVSGPTPLPLEGLVERLPRVERLAPDVEDNVRRQRAQLRRMGPVNPEAQSEYQEVKERYQFMTEQVADLEKAEQDVRQVIADLDALMQAELRRTFDAVAEEFSHIFKRLFGGGAARLVLTDPEDMTNTGIDIEARLPGRRAQGLSLLSGGERSLTAVSLIFALLRVSPTPFCVLDEVDAMLDEANVGRFRDLLRELSQHTQFIIVTHNRNTVQVADVIYGVTMGRDSSSQVISLKLDEVPDIVE